MYSDFDETKVHKVQYECPRCHTPMEEHETQCPNRLCKYLTSGQYSGEFRDGKTFERVPDIVSPSPRQYSDSVMEKPTPLRESEHSQLKDFAHKDWKHNTLSNDSVPVYKKQDKRDRGWGNKAAGTKGSSFENSKDRILVAVRIAALIVFIAVIAFIVFINKEAIQSAVSAFSKSTPTIHVASDVVPPEIGHVSASEVTQDSVIITWVTDEPATSQVEYGTTIDYGNSTPFGAKLETDHNVKVSSLDPSKTYYYRVMSKDASGNSAIFSKVETFTTASPPDTTPPIISGVKLTDVSDSTATITWVTDEKATSRIDYGITSAYGSAVSPDNSLIVNHSVTLSGLVADKTYYFRVKSKDARENEAALDTNQSFKTLPPIPIGPEVGKRAPDFTVYSLDGKQVALSELRGKIVMVNFWALACGACMAEMPDLEAVYKTLDHEKLEVLAINAGDYEIYIKNKIEEEKWTLPIFIDSDRVAVEEYEITSIPRTFFIDTNGVIRKIEMGRFDNQDQIKEALNSLQ